MKEEHLDHHDDITLEKVVQEVKKDHQKYNLSLYLQGKIFQDYVDIHFEGNLITSITCYEVGFTPPIYDDEEEDND